MAITRAPYNFTRMQFTGVLQKNTPVDDNAGGQTDLWTDVLTTRCSLEKETGRLQDGAGKMEYIKDYELVCRYQSAIVIDADSRWVINGQAYKIMDYEQVDMLPHFYTFKVIKDG